MWRIRRIKRTHRKKLVLRAKKLEKKDKIEKAKKLYLEAYDKFEKAYAKDKKNADILN